MSAKLIRNLYFKSTTINNSRSLTEKKKDVDFFKFSYRDKLVIIKRFLLKCACFVFRGQKRINSFSYSEKVFEAGEELV